jgi:hypothetical protein
MVQGAIPIYKGILKVLEIRGILSGIFILAILL